MLAPWAWAISIAVSTPGEAQALLMLYIIL